MKYDGKFSVTWVYEDSEDTYYLVPVSVAEIFSPYDAHPVIASVSSLPSWKSVDVLGVTVWELNCIEDKSGHYLNLAKAEAIAALRRWGFEIEEVEDANC